MTNNAIIGATQRGVYGLMAAFLLLIASVFALLMATPAMAQMRTIDPNSAIDADLQPGAQPTPPPPSSGTPAYPEPQPPVETQPQPATTAAPTTSASSTSASPPAGAAYKRDDVIGAAEGVFGKGAEGLAAMIEKILADQGEPIAYIAGREASGAIGIGLRYGSGTLSHKIEGERPVYWTGPSIGFDVGGNAGKTFILVYNLFDSQELYRRYPAGEGAAYLIGGFNASYLRRGDIVLIPIRLGVGWRLGANVGWMKFSEKRRILPF